MSVDAMKRLARAFCWTVFGKRGGVSARSLTNSLMTNDSVTMNSPCFSAGTNPEGLTYFVPVWFVAQIDIYQFIVKSFFSQGQAAALGKRTDSGTVQFYLFHVGPLFYIVLRVWSSVTRSNPGALNIECPALLPATTISSMVDARDSLAIV